MDRIKEILTLAPFVALAIAATYLHGYWSVFNIHPFPYLGIQELIAYITVPLFGFILSSLAGGLVSALDIAANRGKGESRWAYRLQDFGMFLGIVLLVYFDRPEKWFVTPVVGFALVAPYLLRNPPLKAFRENYPQATISVLIGIFFLIGSYGYGRMRAEDIFLETKQSVQLITDKTTESGKLLGKLGNYYFLLDTTVNVVIIPERSVEQIKYIDQLRGQ